MSILLGKFKTKKRLGKGAYGDVLLVEDPDGAQYAIKIISKKILDQDPFMEEYLQGQKQCMMSVKSKYVMRLHGFEEDENNKYFICEYCDGGDLLNYQAKQPNKVFEIEKATMVLAQVIHGLELLHKMGYLHRDIKPQNILLKKKDSNSDEYNFKLADFGFAKKNQDVGGTVLGTQNYMSPQIYLQDIYSYQVDMWAFGVVFYFMLNAQFPFKINPHCKDIDQKRQDLMKQANNFSYKASIQKSKKKILANCTPELEDLFKKIFNTDQNQRITFRQIRQHPIFKKHFPTISEQSKILYKRGQKKPLNRLDSFIVAKKSGVQKNPKKQKKQPQNQDITPSILIKRGKSKEFPQQKHFIELEYDRIKFIYDTEDQIVNTSGVLSTSEIICLRYCLNKYFIILLRDFIAQLNAQAMQKKKKLQWKQYFKSPIAKKQKKQYQDDLYQAQLKITQTYDVCEPRLNEIVKFNPSFNKIFETQIKDKQFSGNFKEAYRAATGNAYSKIRQVFKNGNKYVYLTTVITLCHAFNKIVIADQQQLEDLFSDYLTKQHLKGKKMDFSALRSWMSMSQKEDLKPIITTTFKKYFG